MADSLVFHMTAFQGDLTDPATVTRLYDTTGPATVLVNNAGMGSVLAPAEQMAFLDMTADQWRRQMDVTLTTAVLVTRAYLPAMLAAGQGRVVMMASVTGPMVSNPGESAYSAAKAAVHGFTKILAKEVGPHGIRVNCVAPYGTVSRDPAAFSSGSRFHPDRNFFGRAFASTSPKDMEKRSRQTVLGRPVAFAEEVASLAVYLASDQAGFITGQVYPVDGGSLL